jgi:hypothetical protein
VSDLPARPPRPWDAFQNPDYRLLWGAGFSASIVVWLRILGTAQWLLDTTGSALLVGFIGVVQLVVQIPALLWGGTLADRIDRKRLITLAHGFTCTALLTLGLLDAQGLLSPAMVYAGIACTAFSQMLASPARSALVPIVIPTRHLMLAASTDTASQNAAAIAGPLLFAVVVASADVTTVFLLAAAISAVSALTPLWIRAGGRATGHGEGPPQSALRQTVDGVRYVARHPILPGLFLLDTGITVASFYREILPVLALGLFAGGASATGLLGAANSAGAIARLAGRCCWWATAPRACWCCTPRWPTALMLFGFGTVTTLWLGALMIALLGAADAVTVAVRQTTVMLTTPDAMRGRAFCADDPRRADREQRGHHLGRRCGPAPSAPANTMVLGSVISIALPCSSGAVAADPRVPLAALITARVRSYGQVAVVGARPRPQQRAPPPPADSASSRSPRRTASLISCAWRCGSASRKLSSPVWRVPSSSPGSAQLQILLGDVEAVLAVADGLQPRPRGGGEGPLVEQDAVGAAAAPAHPTAELMKLGQAHALRVLDHHQRGVGHVHTHLDHRGGDQQVDAPGLEKPAITVAFSAPGKPAVQQPHALRRRSAWPGGRRWISAAARSAAHESSISGHTQ